jgi:hypothetical protein
MKTTFCSIQILALTVCYLILVTSCHAQGGAFSYQGRLNDGANPANGSYDLIFSVWDAASGPAQIGGALTNSAVPLTNGVFTIALDFGPGVFTGSPRWLEIGVRSNGSGSFALLSPRQELRLTPYAMFAASAGVVTNGSVTAGQLRTTGSPSSGQILTYDGSSLVWQTPAASGAWAVAGNNTVGGNFLGTLDNQPLVLKGNNARLLQLDPHPGGPNTLGGAPGNYVATGVEGAVVAGGGTWGTYGGAYTNTVRANYATIGGGLGNLITAGAYESTIAGGNGNTAESNDATVGGGVNNHAKGTSSTVSGGEHNDATGEVSTVSGGRGNDATAVGTTVNGGVFNTASGAFASVPGGANNVAAGDGSLAAGAFARALHSGSFVWADFRVLDSTPFDSVTDNEFAVRAQGGARFDTKYLQVKGTGNEAAYLGGDGVGGEVHVGSLNPAVTNVAVYNSGGNFWMDLSVRTLTILGGADLAEPFEMSSAELPKGAVVVIDEANPGSLKLSTRAYDARVAGVVSGANGIAPGISLQQQGTADRGQNVALTGRVYVQADASLGDINPGDLLTTSDTPGHAMKVMDHSKAQGAILGKAMGRLQDGRGLVLVLVTLQ